ncbi:MAG: uracil-DNA glycosylase [Lentisphaeria bacterium]|nr:uracil-DNA glycosylase [Lentisphaeria bacterium]NQZ67809.1 uracil-DNA glycosylase [Lentisphaeria bacterium]
MSTVDNLIKRIPADWQKVLADEFTKDYFVKLSNWLELERRVHTIFPADGDLFSALQLCKYSEAKVTILGQDPYHDDGQAHGLAFSVKDDVKIPPSLRNIYKELNSDLGISPPGSGNLGPWASQGILLLNTVLTVRAHEANSHRKKGWEEFTNAIINAVNRKKVSHVFILWGANAQTKIDLINEKRHRIIKSVHPSPLSASRGFLGSKPFSLCNAFLSENGQQEINWNLSGSNQQLELF